MPRNETNTETTSTTATNVDPTTAGEEAQTRAEQDRAEANRTVREFGRNSNGEPTMYPSDVEGLATRHNLTADEAELLWHQVVHEGADADSAADDIRNSRTVNQLLVARVPVTPDSHPLAAADARAREQEERAEEEERNAAEARELAYREPEKLNPAEGPTGATVYADVNVNAEGGGS